MSTRTIILITASLLLVALGLFVVTNSQQNNNTSPMVHLRRLAQGGVGVIHLGKCGGVAMEMSIKHPRNKNEIQKRGPHYYHMVKPEISKFQDWMALVRDPVSRIQSSYIYEHPLNAPYRKDQVGKFLWGHRPKFYECYPTLDEALTKGLTTKSKEENDCPMLARKVFSGKVDERFYGMVHNKYDFSYYFTELLRKAILDKSINVYVVRNEKMLDDLKKINVMFGGTEDGFKFITKHDHFGGMPRGTGLPMTNRTISNEGMKNLCKFLCNEIQIYKRLYQRALNFNDQDYNEMIEGLSKKCPIEASLSGCPEMPSLWG
jgi:hypothetical protein